MIKKIQRAPRASNGGDSNYPPVIVRYASDGFVGPDSLADNRCLQAFAGQQADRRIDRQSRQHAVAFIQHFQFASSLKQRPTQFGVVESLRARGSHSKSKLNKPGQFFVTRLRFFVDFYQNVYCLAEALKIVCINENFPCKILD